MSKWVRAGRSPYGHFKHNLHMIQKDPSKKKQLHKTIVVQLVTGYLFTDLMVTLYTPREWWALTETMGSNEIHLLMFWLTLAAGLCFASLWCLFWYTMIDTICMEDNVRAIAEADIAAIRALDEQDNNSLESN